jgi:hypothetical protein
MTAGVLYIAASGGLAGQPRRSVDSRVSPFLLAAAGLGLFGSGVLVTGTGNERPDGTRVEAQPPTREEAPHDLCAVPIFIGIPAAADIAGRGFARHQDGAWARYSRGSAIVMALCFALFSAAFAGTGHLLAWGGALQRISILSEFGWVTAVCPRCRRTPAAPD